MTTSISIEAQKHKKMTRKQTELKNKLLEWMLINQIDNLK